jgi:hypothetical protein
VDAWNMYLKKEERKIKAFQHQLLLHLLP